MVQAAAIARSPYAASSESPGGDGPREILEWLNGGLSSSAAERTTLFEISSADPLAEDHRLVVDRPAAAWVPDSESVLRR